MLSYPGKPNELQKRFEAWKTIENYGKILSANQILNYMKAPIMSIQNSLTKGSIIGFLKNLQYPHDNVTIFSKNARKFPGRSTGGGGEIVP